MTTIKRKSPSRVFKIVNKVLYKIVRKKYGPHIVVRLNSLTFTGNRPVVIEKKSICYVTEEIILKINKKVSLDELLRIQQFLLNQLNCILMMIELDDYIEVTSVRLVVV
jgi:hypothetical protein